MHCADARGGLLPDSRCRHLGRPVSEEFCSEAACPEHSGGWLVGAWGLRCRTRETGYFGMLREPEAGSCLERRGRLEDRNGLG